MTQSLDGPVDPMDAVTREMADNALEDESQSVFPRSIFDWWALLIFFGLCFTVTLQFVSRYFFNASLGWTEELARYFLIGSAFFGSVCVFQHREHIAIPVLGEALKGRSKRVLSVAIDLIVLIFLLAMSWYAVGAAGRVPGTMTSIDLPKNIVHYAVAAAFGCMAIVLAVSLAIDLRKPPEAMPSTSTGRTIPLLAGTIAVPWAIVSLLILAGNAMAALMVSVIGLIIMGMPVFVALGLPSLTYILLTGMAPPLLAAHQFISGVDSFPLIAIPFFIMAGALMNAGMITDRIFSFARALVGWMPGGLGHVNVGASVIFAGMSGAAVADAGGLGAVEIRAMRKAGYDSDFSVGITAASSTIGPIIPPSLPVVIYGVMANVSIGALFAAGILPGLLMAAVLMLMVAWYSHKRAYPRDAHPSVRSVATTFAAAFPSLMTPVLIIGGILLGVFTPTEAAIAAVFWAAALGVYYRTLTVRSLARVSFETLKTTASILVIVAAASLFAWILTTNRVAEDLTAFLLGITEKGWALVLLSLVALLIVGCFMETIAAITILTPVLLPVMTTAGVDPVHYGIVMILALMLGLLTPPLGMVLYVLSAVSSVPFVRCVKATAPFFVALLVALVLIALIPSISLGVPALISGR